MHLKFDSLELIFELIEYIIVIQFILPNEKAEYK